MICGGYWFENIVEMAIITYILVKLNSGYKADLIVLEIFRVNQGILPKLKSIHYV